MKKTLLILTLFFIIGSIMMPVTSSNAAEEKTALFAGGCFWCLEADFEKLPGVLSATSGYTGGQTENPTYADVSGGGTGHYESVKVVFDPSKVTYAALLDYFWRHIDPFDPAGQFCDKGDQYRSAVFYGDGEQKKEAEASKIRAEKTLGRKIVTEIISAGPFYEAEEYHQDYYRKSPAKYKFYRWNCGRDQRVKAVWGAVRLQDRP